MTQLVGLARDKLQTRLWRASVQPVHIILVPHIVVTHHTRRCHTSPSTLSAWNDQCSQEKVADLADGAERRMQEAEVLHSPRTCRAAHWVCGSGGGMTRMPLSQRGKDCK